MSTATAKEPPEPTWNYARLRRHFGMIPAERILLVPRPGIATELFAPRRQGHKRG